MNPLPVTPPILYVVVMMMMMTGPIRRDSDHKSLGKMMAQHQTSTKYESILLYSDFVFDSVQGCYLLF